MDNLGCLLFGADDITFLARCFIALEVADFTKELTTRMLDEIIDVAKTTAIQKCKNDDVFFGSTFLTISLKIEGVRGLF